jgi:dTDP-4-amino-4,6-dideoxygalactose transaminase
MKIPFNKPYLTGKEAHYIYEAVYKYGHLAGNGVYTKKCQKLLENKLGIKKALLTTSCTDALEMAAMLIDIRPGDEVIVPSYTFVSTALAFERQGAEIKFADSKNDHPNIDVSKVEKLITHKTKAIVPVHYAGTAVEMGTLLDLATKYNLFVIEDAAQAIDGYYKHKPLGSIGHLGAFSFHETKNIISGEGGLLAINDERLIERAEILWEKGTNRASFFRGEVNKYGWVDTGSSFLPSEIIAAFLHAQLEEVKNIQNTRKNHWDTYYSRLQIIEEKGVMLPSIPEYGTNNAHMFFLICNNLEERDLLIKFLKEKGIHAVFHYLSLHRSDHYLKNHKLVELTNADKFSDRLVRLPMFYELSDQELNFIIDSVIRFYYASS